MPFARIRDIRMYYERGGNAGSGRRLLWINGSGGDLRQRLADALEPAFRHCLTQRRLARKMTVDGAVADIERPCDVDDRRFGEPVTAQHVLGDFEDALGCQNHGLIHACTISASAGCALIWIGLAVAVAGSAPNRAAWASR